jgi:hypothetical protein
MTARRRAAGALAGALAGAQGASASAAAHPTASLLLRAPEPHTALPARRATIALPPLLNKDQRLAWHQAAQTLQLHSVSQVRLAAREGARPAVSASGTHAARSATRPQGRPAQCARSCVAAAPPSPAARAACPAGPRQRQVPNHQHGAAAHARRGRCRRQRGRHGVPNQGRARQRRRRMRRARAPDLGMVPAGGGRLLGHQRCGGPGDAQL